ncbi:MAG: hypothetical protein E6Q97_15020 [Desulfurellales bacterium]|nr:MAG: hypothetical protein E6Q97_15020 [Desulfurellales bacterium]
MNAKIYSSLNGELIGEVEDFNDARYAEECPNPEGHVKASDILDSDDLAKLGLDGSETVYALTA